MPIELGIWRLGDKLQQIDFQKMESESKLEDTLAAEPSIVAPNVLLIGRQVATDYGKFIDLLAMDREGNLVIMELKRDRTPREVVAQILDYASWVDSLSHDDVSTIYAEHHPGQNLEKGFADIFDGTLPETINESHRMIVVATELDSSTERIINYLGDKFGVPINAVFFRYFCDGDGEYLTRTWLVDPHEAEAKVGKVTSKKKSEPWNGHDFYVSLGDGPNRAWEDCMKYGFISASGGKWYTQTLSALFPGARVFVNIPKTGYVGVGEVIGPSTPVKDFTVPLNGKEVPILDVPLTVDGMKKTSKDLENCEYLVRVEWLKTVPKEQAYWEKGLFAIQHSACKLRNRFTIERLTQHFGLDE